MRECGSSKVLRSHNSQKTRNVWRERINVKGKIHAFQKNSTTRKEEICMHALTITIYVC